MVGVGAGVEDAGVLALAVGLEGLTGAEVGMGGS